MRARIFGSILEKKFHSQLQDSMETLVIFALSKYENPSEEGNEPVKNDGFFEEKEVEVLL